VHYRDEGNKSPGNSNPVIILVHGSNASLHTWEPWVEILGDDYRLITMDLPAHGLTGATPENRYDTAAYIKTVDGVARHLGIEQFVLGGNSMGGGVTWRYTLEYPEKVLAMLLIDSSGLPQFARERVVLDNSGKEREAPIFFTLMSKPWFRAIARFIDPYYLTEQGVRSAYNNSPVVTDALINRYYELAIREGSRDATLARFSGFRGGQTEPVDTSRLGQPTLVMWGAEDALISVDVAHQFAAALPNSELVIYEAVGHIPMEEIPEQSAADVRAFLQRLN